MIKKCLLWFLRGLPLGFANVLPGISGGTTMLVLGFYDELIDALKKLCIKKLLPFGLGVIFSILLASRGVVFILESYPTGTQSVLTGLILASVWVVIKKIGPGRQGLICPLFLLGFVIVAAFTFGTSAFIDLGKNPFLGMFIAGVLSSTAMLLPGISGSTVLVILGLYELTLQAVVQLQFSLLIPFALGVIGGLILLAWVMSFLLTRYPRVTLALLAGMILGSVPMLLIDIWNLRNIFWIGMGFLTVIAIEYVNLSKLRHCVFCKNLL